MRIRFLLPLIAATCLGACNKASVDSQAEPPKTETPSTEAEAVAVEPAVVGKKLKLAAGETKTYGRALGAQEAIPFATLLAKADSYSGKSVLIDGAVRKACTAKGCWMELAETASSEGQGCRVTFEDYAFFVPTTAAGAMARIEGTVEVKTVAADEVAHLEGEGAKFANKNADGTAREVRIIAEAVQLSMPAKTATAQKL